MNATSVRWGLARPMAAALLMLALGSLVYLVDRASLRSDVGLALLLGSLPSFAHAFAFTVLGIVLLARTRRQALGIALAWLLIDGLLELAQWTAVQKALPFWPRGQFDPLDLAALLLGTTLAYLGMWTHDKRETSR